MPLFMLISGYLSWGSIQKAVGKKERRALLSRRASALLSPVFLWTAVDYARILLLNYFTKINKKQLENTGLKTNDYLLGVGYTGMMDDMTVEYGLEALPDENCIAEALIHPCKYNSNIKDSHYNEFLITQNKELENKIYRLGFEITNYKQL